MKRILRCSLIGVFAVSVSLDARTITFLPTKTLEVTENNWVSLKQAMVPSSRLFHGMVEIVDPKTKRSCVRSSEIQSEIDNILSALSFGLGLSKEYLNSDEAGLSCAFTLKKRYLEYNSDIDDSNTTDLQDFILGENGDFEEEVVQLTDRLNKLGIDINATQLLQAPSK